MSVSYTHLTVDLSTKFSKNIELKIPFVTAAMDTVTEAKMAIAIAREGGIDVYKRQIYACLVYLFYFVSAYKVKLLNINPS